ncbi:MAG: hypothetical protein IE922_01480, partial [Sphingomonadales bacterium]|nr:hypothetical protein [Sphingomonadales bacterium]
MLRKILVLALALIAAAAPAHAAPVAAAIGAVASWVGSAFAAGGFFTTAVGRLVLGVGASLLSRALAPKPKSQGSSVSVDIVMGEENPQQFPLGFSVAEPRRKYAGTWGASNEYMVEVLELSNLPVNGFGGVWVDGAAAQWAEGALIGDSGNNIAGNMGARVGNAEGWVAVKLYRGDQIAADAYLVSKFGGSARPWGADRIGRGCAYAIVTWVYNDQRSSAPSLVFELTGIRLYDLRNDSTNGGSGSERWDNPATWTGTGDHNPAIQAYNVARGIYYGSEHVFGGKNVPAWRLPSSSWIAAANECGVPVLLAGGGSEPSYRAGQRISVDSEPLEIMERLERAANMRLAEVGGTLKPLIGVPGGAVYAFSDDNVVITEGQSLAPFPALAETYNTLAATYPEPGDVWAMRDAPEFSDSAAIAADDGRYLPASISYDAVPYGYQVQRLMRSQMLDYRRMRVHQVTLPPEADMLEPNDVVSWSSARNGYIGKLFAVTAVVRRASRCPVLTLREIDPADYDWSSAYETPVATGWVGAITPPVQVITGWTVQAETVVDNASRARLAGIRVSCAADVAGVTNVRVQVRLAGGAVVLDTDALPYGAPFSWIITAGLSGATSYEVRGIYISTARATQDWSAWLPVTTDDLRVGEADLDPTIPQAIAAAAQAADDVRAD